MNRRQFVLGLVTTTLAVTATAQAKSGRIEKLITLTGTGKGKARYRIDPGNKRSLSVEVQNLKSLAGQTLTVSAVVGGTPQDLAPMLISSKGTGGIELQTERGQQVPNVQPGTQILVKNGATTVLTGTF